MSMVNEIAAVAALAVAGSYIMRLNPLQFSRHEFTFVAAHVLGAGASIYSAYLLTQQGIDVLPIASPAMAALYLFRSRDTYIEQTAPMPLDATDSFQTRRR